MSCSEDGCVETPTKFLPELRTVLCSYHAEIFDLKMDIGVCKKWVKFIEVPPHIKERVRIIIRVWRSILFDGTKNDNAVACLHDLNTLARAFHCNAIYLRYKITQMHLFFVHVSRFRDVVCAKKIQRAWLKHYYHPAHPRNPAKLWADEIGL